MDHSRASRSLVLGLAAVFVVAAGGAAASAQTARDATKEHVDRELDKSKRKKKKKSRSRDKGDRRSIGTGRDAGPADPADSGGTTYEVSFDDPTLSEDGPRLPRRLLAGAADYIELDLKLDGAYWGWLAQQYESADVDVASYATWRAGIKARFFKKVAIYRGYYESSGLSAPRNTAASIAAKVGGASPKAAKALAYIGLSFWKVAHPIVRYEARAFSTSATPKIPVCIVGRNDSVDDMSCPRTTDELEVVSSYETLVAGVRIALPYRSRSIFATKKGEAPPFYVGVGALSYGKPYQLTIDGETLEEYLFDGRFRGLGLAAGTELGGGPRRLFATADLQLGLGEVQLTDDFTLNEITPDDWLIGYIQGNLRAGYRWVVYRGAPTITLTPVVSAGGASFHFVNTSGEGTDTPNLNWDFLWSARASLQIAL